MGDSAPETAEPEEGIETQPVEQDEQEPFAFNVNEEQEEKQETPDKESAEQAEQKPSEIDELKKQLTALTEQNAKQQALLNKKFYELRHAQKQKEPEAEPGLTEAQLLKILEEHQNEPAVQMQVFKQMLTQHGKQTEKKAVDSAEIRQQQARADEWLRTNIPQVYEEGSELHEQTERMKEMMRLTDHPLGDFLATSAAMLAGHEEAIKKAREEERKKVLTELSEQSRKKTVKNAAPAGGKTTSKAAAGANDSEYIKQGKAMGLTGGALTNYVQIRKNAAKQSTRTIQES